MSADSPRLHIPPGERSLEEAAWLDPERPLPEGSQILPVGQKTKGAALFPLIGGAVLFLLFLAQLAQDLPKGTLGPGAPLMGLAGLAALAWGFKEWRAAARDAAAVAAGRWRQGVMLLPEALVLHQEGNLCVIPRARVIETRRLGQSREGGGAMVVVYRDDEAAVDQELILFQEPPFGAKGVIEGWAGGG